MSSGKCFAKGSAAPGPIPNDLIRLYSMRFCPFAHRTMLVLNAKGIKHEIINIHLKEKPDWFLEKDPVGLVPVVETPKGEVIHGSLIICDYLDEVYPEKKLLPSSPFGKAQQKMILEEFSKAPPYYAKIVMGRSKGEDVSELESELKTIFAKLNIELVKKKTKFFGGDTITMVDYMMWPFFERLDILEMKNPLEKTPELKRWTELMPQDSAVKATMLRVDTYKAFSKTVATGNPDYDLGL